VTNTNTKEKLGLVIFFPFLNFIILPLGKNGSDYFCCKGKFADGITGHVDDLSSL
jgi:hypothetical protein